MSPLSRIPDMLEPDLDHPTRTRIVATIGPASDSPEMVRKLIRSGVSVFRFNFSHGSFEDHARRLATVRQAASELDRPIACMGDLQGPKIRIGKVPDGGIELSAGQDLVFLRNLDTACLVDGVPQLPTTYEGLFREVEPGQRVLINDGAIRLLAVDADPNGGVLRCRVTVGGAVTSGKGINLPESDVKAPAITPRDWECVEWAVAQGLDLLALSFVRTPEEVIQLKDRLSGMCSIDRKSDDEGSMIPVVAKIERPQALANIDGIVEASDAIMVARGDLGVEMDFARTPVAQKLIISRCAVFGKPCIVATQMLESMIDSASPTRAEASDVANAIFDGADAVMLSAETATGKHPDLAVETMRRISAAAEAWLRTQPRPSRPASKLLEAGDVLFSVAEGAAAIATHLKAKMLVCWSERGRLARALSQADLQTPILAYSSSDLQTRRMALLRGVTALRTDPPASGRLVEWTDRVEQTLKSRGWAQDGDVVLLVAGKPLGSVKASDTISVLRVGDRATGFRSS